MDATTASDLLVVDAVFDSLTAWGDDLAPVPAAAARWRPDESLRRWRFELDPQGSFHDGTAVTAEAFVAAWSATARGGLAHHHLRDVDGYDDVRSGDARRLSGVRAVDRHTLEVVLTRPVADFPAVVAHPALGPTPDADEAALRRMPVGNGPFRMAEPWAAGRFVRLRRAATPAADARLAGRWVDEVVFRFQDEASRYVAYQQGRVDVADLPVGATAAPHRPRARSTRETGAGSAPSRLPTTYFLWFDTTREPFDDVAVRRAVSLAIDRGRLVREAFGGSASPAASVVPSVVPGGRLRSCDACHRDPAAARATLRRAGVDRLPLWISEGGEHERVAETVRRDLAAVGVDVEIRAVPFDAFVRRLRRGTRGLFRFGWTLDYASAESGLRPLFHSTATPERGGANYGRYADATVDRLLDEASATAADAQRRALLRRVEDIVAGRDQAIIPLVNPRRTTAVAPRVRGLVYGPLGTANLAQVRVLDR